MAYSNGERREGSIRRWTVLAGDAEMAAVSEATTDLKGEPAGMGESWWKLSRESGG